MTQNKNPTGDSVVISASHRHTRVMGPWEPDQDKGFLPSYKSSLVSSRASMLNLRAYKANDHSRGESMVRIYPQKLWHMRGSHLFTLGLFNDFTRILARAQPPLVSKYFSNLELINQVLKINGNTFYSIHTIVAEWIPSSINTAPPTVLLII